MRALRRGADAGDTVRSRRPGYERGMEMPEIVWLKSDDARILAGTTVRVGSKVKVRGRYYAGGLPSRFKVLQGHGKLVRRFLKERKKPEFTSREEYLDAIETSAMSVVSEALTIPTLGLMHFNASFLLEDDFGNRSPLPSGIYHNCFSNQLHSGQGSQGGNQLCDRSSHPEVRRRRAKS